MSAPFDNVTKKLDAEFDGILASMKFYVLQLPHKSERQKCAVWIKKLCEETFGGVSGRRNRNDHAKLMLHMLKTLGHLDGPFNEKPEAQIANLSRYDLSQDRTRDLEERNSFRKRRDLSNRDEGHETTDTSVASAGHGIREDVSVARWWESKVVSGGVTSDSDATPVDAPARRPLTTENRENSLRRNLDKGSEMKMKVLEAKFQEEKLKLQQRHDDDVQKILERKNSEIEEIRVEYRSKIREHEDRARVTQKKLDNLVRESAQLRETKEKQLDELRRLAEETQQSRADDCQRKINDVVAAFEQEKFQLQKQNTMNMEELLRETNERLAKMEADYAKEADDNALVVKDLERRIAALTEDAELAASGRQRMIQEMALMEARGDEMGEKMKQMEEEKKRLEKEAASERKEHEDRLLRIEEGYKSNADLLRRELEAAKERLRRSEEEKAAAEQRRDRLVVETEENKATLEKLADTLHSLEQDSQRMEKRARESETELNARVVRLEESLKAKKRENERLKAELESQVEKSEKTLADFQTNIQQSAERTYEEMKAQMRTVESDLEKSRVAREKQGKEMRRQMEEERSAAQREIDRLRAEAETLRLTLTKDAMLEKEVLRKAKEEEIEQLKSLHFSEMERIVEEWGTKKEADDGVLAELEEQLKDARQHLADCHSRYAQEIRESNAKNEESLNEAKNSLEELVRKHRSEMEQQRLIQAKQHAADMETTLGNAGQKLKKIEDEYRSRVDAEMRRSETLAQELATARSDFRLEEERRRTEAEELMERHRTELELEKNEWKTENLSLHQEIEKQREKNRWLERNTEHQRLEWEDQITQIKLEQEEKISKMLPSDLRCQLEETIASLKSQVQSLNKRAALLQGDGNFT